MRNVITYTPRKIKDTTSLTNGYLLHFILRCVTIHGNVFYNKGVHGRMNRSLLRMMTELSSRKFVSRITGRFAKSSLSRRWIPRFAAMYKIPVEEAEKRLEEYDSLNDFFTRRLKPGSRPVDPSSNALVSPVDAKITACGTIEDGQLLQVKGQDYTLEELLHGSPRTSQYLHGYFWVLYLSPTDYHRIHSPCEGDVVESEHIPGRVYPVNEFGLTSMRRVLSRNERLVSYIRHSLGEVAVVKVGALNVSEHQVCRTRAQSIGTRTRACVFRIRVHNRPYLRKTEHCFQELISRLATR